MYLLHLQNEHQQLRLCNSEGKVQQLLIAVQTDHPVLCTYLRSRCSLLHIQLLQSDCKRRSDTFILLRLQSQQAIPIFNFATHC